MKIIVSVEINRPRAKLIPLLANPATAKHWMDDLDSYKLLSGTPGTPGAKARLSFGGKRPMQFVATTLASNSPNEVRSALESPMVHIQAVGRFEAVTEAKTRYISEQVFEFKGPVNRAVGFLARSAIKKQQQKHADGFKRFAEGKASTT